MNKILCDRWVNSGIESGDVILIHSNIGRTLKEFIRKGMYITPQDILRSYLEVIGPRGTLLLPVFNFDFTRGTAFDIIKTPSQMGVMTELARKLPEAVRTGHPIYSFVALGYHSRLFSDVDNRSGYAENSPFGIVRALDGKIAVLDLDDQNSMTFYHHVEEIKCVNYRYFKTFSGEYVGYDRNKVEKEYDIFVRNLDKRILTDVNPAGELLWAAGLYKGNRPGIDSGLRVIKAQIFFNFVSDIIDNNKSLGLLYSIGE